MIFYGCFFVMGRKIELDCGLYLVVSKFIYFNLKKVLLFEYVCDNATASVILCKSLKVAKAIKKSFKKDH